MELPVVNDITVKSEYVWSRIADFTPEQKLAAYMLKDSIENVLERNKYKHDSFLLLVDAYGELSFWLGFFPKKYHDAVLTGIDKFLKSQTHLNM